jgi:hypothetical protein
LADPSLQPTCPPSTRPQALFAPATTVHGLRAAQSRLVGGQRFLDVWLFHDPPAGLEVKEVWKLVPAPGGAKVAVTAAAFESAPSKHVVLTLVGLPDVARYRLEVAPPGGVDFDPLRTWLPVRLRPECPDLGSCFDPPPQASATPPSPVHDYLARDWRSLRRMLLEYLVREQPDADLSIADPTITMLELFAHAGDVLHYRLDRIATEAYLETARLRTSVKRHARLVDFAFSDGVSAQTYVHVALAPNDDDVDVHAGDVAVDEAGSELAFALEVDLTAHASLGEIPIYDWGEEACCLPAGATECVLVRPTPADDLGSGWLAAGDLLVFEVVDPDDAARHADWARRDQDWPTDAASTERFREPLASRPAQIVQLVHVEDFEDPLMAPGMPLTLVRWRREDALARALPVGVDSSEGGDEVAVARGNLVPAHHGRLVVERHEPDSEAIAGFALPSAGAPARGRRAGGPRLSFSADGSPRVAVSVELPSGGDPIPAQVIASLLEADEQLSVVVDVEEDDAPLVRFRTGAVGQTPPIGSRVVVSYEVGGGSRGNVPANALRTIERNTSGPGLAPSWVDVEGLRVRNPAPAAGGADPTPLDDVRRDAPEAFVVDLRRAVIPADYAAEARRSSLVERAMTQRSWSGSWPLMTTVVDLVDPDTEPAEALAGLQASIDDVRMLGTEAAVRVGTPVGLFISLDVCVGPGSDPEDVRLLVLQRLRPGSDECPGLFHPSRLQLGAEVYVSAVVAAAAAVPGVDAVKVQEARRLNEPKGTVREVIALAADEVAVLDDDPSRPQRGRLDVQVRGGR